MLFDLPFSWPALAVAALAAFTVGMAKNGVPGVGILIIPLLAMVVPAKTSVGLLLPFLIVGDIMAILYFRRHARWRLIAGLVPFVVLGVALGTWILKDIDNRQLKPLLGFLVLGLLAIQLLRTRLKWEKMDAHPLFTGSIGAATGFATTVGNAAGPIMNLYWLSRKLPKHAFVGTAGWFFFLLNSSKVPIYMRLDMITRDTLLVNLLIFPLVLGGAWAGRRILPLLSQQFFNRMVMILTAIAALALIGAR